MSGLIAVGILSCLCGAGCFFFRSWSAYSYVNVMEIIVEIYLVKKSPQPPTCIKDTTAL